MIRSVAANLPEAALLSYRNPEFIESDAARPIRILAEYLHPLEAFERHNVRDTVVFFGSARIAEKGPFSRYYEEARVLARRLTEWSSGLDCDRCRFVVCTGGGPGIMEAANRGALDAGGQTIGLNIGLPHEQRPNPYITPELMFEFHYFFMRKLWFAHLARAMVVFPGGFGTLDELFEVLTLSQTGKLATKMRVLLYGSDYWKEIVNFEALARHGMISPQDLELFQVVDDPDTALDLLTQQLAPQPKPAHVGFAKSTTPEDPAAVGEARTRPPGHPELSGATEEPR